MTISSKRSKVTRWVSLCLQKSLFSIGVIRVSHPVWWLYMFPFAPCLYLQDLLVQPQHHLLLIRYHFKTAFFYELRQEQDDTLRALE